MATYAEAAQSPVDSSSTSSHSSTSGSSGSTDESQLPRDVDATARRAVAASMAAEIAAASNRRRRAQRRVEGSGLDCHHSSNSEAGGDSTDEIDDLSLHGGDESTVPPWRVEDGYGKTYMRQLLAAPEQLYEVSRLHKEAFLKLAAWLKDHGLADGRLCSVRQKLLIFLVVTGQGGFHRHTASTLRHSISTISRCFHEVLTGLCKLHEEIVYIPKPNVDQTPIQLTGKNRLFNKCLGALDGTHIKVYVKAGPQSIKWMGRKSGTYTQNVLAVVDFDCRFLYVLAGYEGQAHDNLVLDKAREVDGFCAPQGYYFLGDAGYTSKLVDVMVPWPKTRYHLVDLYAAPNKPENGPELFNMRHSSLRNCVERTFGVFKRRWRIFEQSREFSIATQTRLVYALTAVSNWILDEDDLDEDGGVDAEAAMILGEQSGMIEPRRRPGRVARNQESPMEKLRAEITIRMWNNWMDLRVQAEGGLPRRGHTQQRRARRGRQNALDHDNGHVDADEDDEQEDDDRDH